MRLLSISLFVWRGSGRISSQTEVLQSPWIPETCSRHLLIFSSAKYNYTQSCLLAGTLVTAFFVRGLFLKNLIFLLLWSGSECQWWNLHLCVFLLLYLCISCLSLCIFICISGVFVYFHQFQASPGRLARARLTSRLSTEDWRQTLTECADSQPLPIYNQLSPAKVFSGLVFELAPCISVLKWNYHEWNYFKKEINFWKLQKKNNFWKPQKKK